VNRCRRCGAPAAGERCADCTGRRGRWPTQTRLGEWAPLRYAAPRAPAPAPASPRALVLVGAGLAGPALAAGLRLAVVGAAVRLAFGPEEIASPEWWRATSEAGWRALQRWPLVPGPFGDGAAGRAKSTAANPIHHALALAICRRRSPRGLR
jgi:hypothetical protein